MSMDNKVILELAHLARIAADEKSVASLATDLGKMMDMVRHVQDVDTSKIDALVHLQDGSQRLRDDTPVKPDAKLANSAKESDGGFVVVPRVLP